MSSDYFIIIKNQSGEIQNYLLFNDVPTRGALGTPYSNVWERSAGVFSPKGSAKFQFSTELFAVCGSTVTKKAIGVKMQIDTSDWANVTLTTTNPNKDGVDANMIVESGGCGFDNTPGKIKEPASYGIKTPTFDLNRFPYFWCGMGKLDSEGNIAPCVTWQAKPSKSYVVTPVLKFWVSTGSYTAGMVVDQTMFGDIAGIDFTGRKETIATVIHREDGTYSDAEYTHPKTLNFKEVVNLHQGTITSYEENVQKAIEQAA